jgi:ADP-heptose:LPS heptosyltransferase
MLLPTIQALRTNFSAASIDFLTLETNRDALNMTGTVENIFSIDTSTPFTFLASCRRTITTLQRNQYDLIIDFEQFARFSTLMTALIGAATTIGFKTCGQQRHVLYTDPVPYNNEVHITQSFFELAKKAGVTSSFSSEVSLECTGNLQEHGRVLLSTYGVTPEEITVVMHIGTSQNFSERRWPAERYAALGNSLAERYHVRIILTGLADEVHLTKATLKDMHNRYNAIDLGGQLSFEEYFSLISVADLVISADTAAVHLASAAQTPVVGLYGPNSPQLYGPWGASHLSLYADFDCSPCITNFNSKINTCRHHDGRGACMKALTADEVFVAIENTFFTPGEAFHLVKLRGRRT